MHGRFMRRAIALAVLALGLMLTGFAGAAPGDFVAQVTFSQDCGSGLGVGVAYDGAGHLWVSCYASNPDLLRASASTGTVAPQIWGSLMAPRLTTGGLKHR